MALNGDKAADCKIVLVSGASGYVASHVVNLLLSEGYRVRGTVRSLTNEAKVTPLRELCSAARFPLELVEADLNQPDSWDGAVDGCAYVIHVASPFPSRPPVHEDDLIRPAVDGTLAVLRMCSKHRVKRVVLTSSVAAIFGDLSARDAEGKVSNENDWTDTETAKDAYVKSKTLAERAAWDFLAQLPDVDRFELAVVNPVYVLGPMLMSSQGDITSSEIVKRLMNKEMPLVPRFNFSIVDVRDVALAHLRAMIVPEAAGHRHIVYSGQNLWLQEIAILLEKEFKSQGYSIPTANCPYPFLWMTSLFDKTVKLALPLYNKEQHMDNTRMKSVLGISPIDANTTVIDMAYDLIEKGIVKKTKKYLPRPSSGL